MRSTSKTRALIEILGFLGVLSLYVAFRPFLAGKAIYIVPTVGFCAVYLTHNLKKQPKVLRELGIRFDNFWMAVRLAAAFFVPAMLTVLIISVQKGTFPPPPSFFYLLLLYPIWGTAQQLLIQSFFHIRLIRVGLAPWSIFVVAVVFALAHLPLLELVPICFLGGLISSFCFWKQPNIFALGTLHGFLAAMFYTMILDRDVLGTFLRSLN